MLLTCPSCENFVELDDQRDGSGTSCPTCGHELTIRDEERTATHKGAYDSVGHFQLLDELGRGAYGSVWKAKDTKLDRNVAIKMPHRFDLDEREREVFLREARAAAQLQHPNIVGIYEIGTRDEKLFIVSDFIQGANLKEWLSGYQPDARRIASIVATIADALHHAHEQGVIHRDLKPANIMMDGEDRPFIMDFGMAKRESGEASMTLDGQVMGTPMYMSPEQAKGKSKEVDRRADIYSLGVILFEMLTGEKPFRGEARVVMSKIINEESPSPRSLKTTIPRDLDTICLKCLEKEPSRRYPDADSVARELNRFLDGNPIQARPISRLSRCWRTIQKWPVVSSLVALLMIVVIGGFSGITSQWLRANREWNRAELNGENLAREEAEKSQNLYVAHMNMVQQAWDKGLVLRVREVLNRHLPVDGKPDLRTFEWYLYDGLCKQALAIPKIEFGEKVSSIAVTPDGQLLAMAGENEKLEIWHIPTRRKLQELKDARANTKTLRFSVDGNCLIGTGGAELTIWKRVGTSSKFEKAVTRKATRNQTVRISSQGKHCVIAERNQLWVYQGEFENPRSIEFEQSIDDFCFFRGENQVLVSVSREEQASILRCQLATGEIETLDGQGREPIHNLLVSSDDEHLVTVSGDGAFRYELTAAGKLGSRQRFRQFPLFDVRLLPMDDADHFAAITGNQLSVWKFDQSNSMARLDQSHWFSQAVRVSTREPLIATSGFDSVVRLWDSRTLKLKRTLQGHSNRVYGIDFLPEGGMVTGSRDHSVRIWYPTGPQGIQSFHSSDDWLWSVDISPDGNSLATCGWDSNVDIWNLEDGSRIAELTDSQKSLQFIRYSPDGKWIVAGGYDKVIYVWDATTYKKVNELKGHQATVNSFGFSSNSQYLASGSNDGTLIVWDLKNGRPHKSVTMESGHDIWAVAFSPIDNEVVFGGKNHSVHRWRFEESEQAEPIIDLKENVTGLTYSAKGKRLSITSADGMITVWDLEADAKVHHLYGHATDAMFTAFSPDGKTLVSAGAEGGLQFWNLLTGEPTAFIKAHEIHAHSVVFSRDGKRLATASWDGSSKVYSIE